MNEASDTFINRSWNIADDQSNANYSVGKKIIYSTEVLKSKLSDYNNAYILVRGDIAIRRHNVAQGPFKNCASFTKCFTKIDGTAR